jgi:hypothetical protein
VVRPRLFVAARVLDALTPDELDVSLRHELAHRRYRDNLKRVLAACAPDLLTLVGLSRRVDNRWRAEQEFAADATAVGDNQSHALSLASALVKVSRLAQVPEGARVPLLAGSHFYEGTLLAARIDRLLNAGSPASRLATVPPVWPVPLAGLALLALMLPSQTVWLTVHLVTEGLIRVLP